MHTDGSVEAKEVVEWFIKKFCLKLIDTFPIRIADPYNLKSIHKAVNEIYVKGLEEVNLQEVINVPDNLDEEEISDWLSDSYGWCHFGWYEI